MLKRVLSVLCGCVCSLVMSQAAVAKVIVINPDFEQGWYGWKKSGSAAISGEGRDDESSAKTTGEGGRFEQEVQVKPNTNYTLAVFLKGSGKIGATVTTEATEEQKLINKFQEFSIQTYANDDYHGDWEIIEVDFNSGIGDKVIIFGAYEDGGKGRFDRFRVKRKRD
ncbi:carbohydrate binding domain-containing protein [Agarivorans aestuarii]|uniref:Carbohydrate binding domain-containing protein n=1 Tax=Agarivorans aestuarii TaxID=1563703 RepID=A0ABU7G3P2_9ALTE|nr:MULTISPECIES: carbohydrate binding domain-containing protein [Agarivorans]MEE1673794.1 carbohydrate binding domain-containing protein [Agarivorans aestuarii]